MTHRIAVIPGDGIGKEVVPEGIRILEVAGHRFGFDFTWSSFDWSCETYAKTGHMMPEDGLGRLRGFEALKALDGAETCLARIKIDLFYIVQDIDQEIAKLDDLRLGKVTGPFIPVDIPPHSDDRTDRP